MAGNKVASTLLQGLGLGTGARGVSTVLGGARMLLRHGLPSGVMLGPDGQLVFKDADAQDAEAFGPDFAVVPESTTAEELPDALKHEGRHNQQLRVLGPAAEPAQMLEGFVAPYGHGPLEADTFRHEQPTGEFARKGPQGGYSKALAGFLRGVLGD
jgi:hypothetical protein